METLAYVANSGSNSVSVVDLKARRETAQIAAGEEPVAARLAPDGKTLVVANQRGNSATLIDPASRKVRAVFAGCPGASSVVILPDSSKAFRAVLCRSSSDGHRFGAARCPPRQPDRLETLMDVGRAPVDLALKPDGGEIFVSNSLSDSVSEIYNTTDEVGDTYMIGNDPVRGLVSRDNSLLYVANLRSQEVTVYSIDDGKRVGCDLTSATAPRRWHFRQPGTCCLWPISRSGDVAVVRTVNAIALYDAPRRPRSQRHRR